MILLAVHTKAVSRRYILNTIDKVLEKHRFSEFKITYWSYNEYFWVTLLTPEQFEIVELMFHDQDSDLAFQEYIFNVDWLPIILVETSENGLQELQQRLDKHITDNNIVKWLEAVNQALKHMEYAFDEMTSTKHYIPKLKLLNQSWESSTFIENQLTPMSAPIFNA